MMIFLLLYLPMEQSELEEILRLVDLSVRVHELVEMCTLTSAF